MNTLALDTIDAERALRVKSRNVTLDDVDRMLDDMLAPLAGTGLSARARAAYAFAKTIDYHHPGLSIASYLSHPVRVASLALQVIRPPDETVTVLALLHNVFELSDVAPEEIATRFGRPIAEAIRVLTVDRSQKTRDYTVGYYRALQAMPPYVRMIKVLDKFDNLFVLCLNPGEDVRRAYLADIEEFVAPMVAADLPHLKPYFDRLVANCHAVGFLDTAAAVVQG